jgi:hypothetical protein
MKLHTAAGFCNFFSTGSLFHGARVCRRFASIRDHLFMKPSHQPLEKAFFRGGT